MSDVFISYSSKDKEIAERIALDVKQLGLSVFYDKELVPGEVWGPRLAQELRRARYVLILLSPAYTESRWARRELEAAVLSEPEGGPRIVPIIVQGSEVPAFLRDRHYADLRRDYESGFAQVKRALAKRPEPTDESRARRSAWAKFILSVMGSLIAAATGAILSLEATILVMEPSTLSLAIGVIAGLTALVGGISIYRQHRRAGPLETVTRGVERAYIDALDESGLNPLRMRESSHG